VSVLKIKVGDKMSVLDNFGKIKHTKFNHDDLMGGSSFDEKDGVD